jgi:hypothetical protein
MRQTTTQFSEFEPGVSLSTVAGGEQMTSETITRRTLTSTSTAVAIASSAALSNPQRLEPAPATRYPGWDDRFELQLKVSGLDRLWVLTETLHQRCPDLPIVVTPIGDGLGVYHGAGMSSFARELGTTRPVTEREIEALEQFYFSRGCPARIWISDRTHPSVVGILRSRGYAAQPAVQTWYRPLTAAPIPQVKAAERLQVSPCCRTEWEEWTTTVSTGFCEEDSALDAGSTPAPVRNLFFALGCAPGDQPFLARRGEQLVGGAVLSLFGELAMLRTASTRFVYRNSGIQQTLISVRLRAAEESGARVAVTQTPTHGPSAHNVQKFGFRPLRLGYIEEKSIPSGAR